MSVLIDEMRMTCSMFVLEPTKNMPGIINVHHHKCTCASSHIVYHNMILFYSTGQSETFRASLSVRSASNLHWAKRWFVIISYPQDHFQNWTYELNLVKFCIPFFVLWTSNMHLFLIIHVSKSHGAIYRNRILFQYYSYIFFHIYIWVFEFFPADAPCWNVSLSVVVEISRPSGYYYNYILSPLYSTALCITFLYTFSAIVWLLDIDRTNKHLYIYDISIKIYIMCTMYIIIILLKSIYNCHMKCHG